MNRIRELRERRGLTVYELAERIGTTGAQISRLELGQRKLTEDWMRKLALALDVHPAELLAAASYADIHTDVEPADPQSAIARALSKQGFRVYTVIGDSVENLGISYDDIIAVDCRREAVANLQSGRVVLVRMERDNREPVLALRQFVAPSLIHTNRQGANVILNLRDADLGLNLSIMGVVVRDE